MDLLAGPISAHGMGLYVVGGEIDRAQLALGIEVDLIGEMGRVEIAALAAGAERAGDDLRPELDRCDEAVALRAIIALRPG